MPNNFKYSYNNKSSNVSTCDEGRHLTKKDDKYYWDLAGTYFKDDSKFANGGNLYYYGREIPPFNMSLPLKTGFDSFGSPIQSEANKQFETEYKKVQQNAYKSIVEKQRKEQQDRSLKMLGLNPLTQEGRQMINDSNELIFEWNLRTLDASEGLKTATNQRRQRDLYIRQEFQQLFGGENL